jgi:hypothetical protein
MNTKLILNGFGVVAFASSSCAETPQKPNIVYILADDLG